MHTRDRRKAVITEAGKSREALTRPWTEEEMPNGLQHKPVAGVLNGEPVEFIRTSGGGYYYAYFRALGKPWYVDTGTGLLSEGAAIEFSGEQWVT